MWRNVAREEKLYEINNSKQIKPPYLPVLGSKVEYGNTLNVITVTILSVDSHSLNSLRFKSS